MEGELRYRIRFTSGSLEGQLFTLGAEPVTVGRSHTCGIRLMEADVSGRHIMLSAGPKGVDLEVISSRRTLLGDQMLKTGDKLPVKAGQTVTMGRAAAFELECYRSDGDQTEAPMSDGLTRLGLTGMSSGAAGRAGDTVRAGGLPRTAGEMTTASGGISADSLETAAPRQDGVPTNAPRTGTIGLDTTYGRTFGTRVIPPVPQPKTQPPGGGTAGPATAPPAPPAADETQVIQTRVATPQEMAYMRELHSKKQRRRLGTRIALGALFAALAGGLYVWMAVHAPEQVLSIPSPRKNWKVMDSEMRPIAPGDAAGAGNSVYFSYPAAGGWGTESTATEANAQLGTETTVFSVKTRVGRDLDVPLQLRLVAYASPFSLNQSQEESFADWDRTSGLGLEKQARLATDFIGAAPGIPCLRYTYTRKATPQEEAEGVLDWAGVMSFFRYHDTCFAYFREVPSVEELRAEHMLLRSAVFLGISSPLVQERWMGMEPSRQYGGQIAMLRNSAKELMDKNMDNEWDELEDKLTTILIRTFPKRGLDPDSAQLYDEVLEWLRILRARQTETWKKRSVIRFRAARDKDADVKRMDEEIRALFRSPDDRRHYTAQKDKWWAQ